MIEYNNNHRVGHESPTIYTFLLFNFWMGLTLGFPELIPALIA